MKWRLFARDVMLLKAPGSPLGRARELQAQACKGKADPGSPSNHSQPCGRRATTVCTLRHICVRCSVSSDGERTEGAALRVWDFAMIVHEEKHIGSQIGAAIIRVEISGKARGLECVAGHVDCWRIKIFRRML